MGNPYVSFPDRQISGSETIEGDRFFLLMRDLCPSLDDIGVRIGSVTELLCPDGTSESFTALNLPGHHNYLMRVITQEKVYLWFPVQQISRVSIMGTTSWVVCSKNSYSVF